MTKGLYSNSQNMAPTTIHMKIAGLVADILSINISGQLLLGSIAPDAVYARVNWEQEDVKNSHYRQESVKASWFSALSEFNSTKNPFLQGYCIHIMTDVLWLSSIYSNLKKEHADDFSVAMLIDDMNYLENWLFRKNEFKSLWNGILGTKITNINYYVSPGEIELFKSQKSQSIRYDLVNDKMNYLTLDDIDLFIERSAARIASELQK